MDSGPPPAYRDLWFDDGNLVIQAGQALFRVHKGVLCFHSNVLRDMASLPAPASFDAYEGAQLAEFPDDAQDMHHFLRAIYIPDYFLPPPEMTTFERLEGVLRLAHKYDAPSLRRRALQHMARACVTDLDELKDEINLDRSYTATFDDLSPLLKAEIALAREVQALWALPILLLNMSLCDGHEITGTCRYAGKLRSLSIEDTIASLCVYKAVMDSDIHNIFYSETCGSPTCTRREKAVVAVDIASTRVKPLTALDEWVSKGAWGACSPVCRSMARVGYVKEKRRIWDSLPEVSGLPPWDKLLEMKKLDIEPDFDAKNDIRNPRMRAGSKIAQEFPDAMLKLCHACRPDIDCAFAPATIEVEPPLPTYVAVASESGACAGSREFADVVSMESTYRDLWFDDGNLVIQTGLALFRVHKGVLAIHATVFRDMVSLPTPASQETYEGVQLAVFPDDAQDMRHFLRALYFPDYFLPPPARTSFGVLEGVLRLSHKYDVGPLRRRALQHLSITCPTELANLENELELERSYDIEDVACTLKAELALAREVQALWLLPVLCLCLAREEREDYISRPIWMGKERGIAPDDILMCFFAYRAIADARIIHLFLDSSAGCGKVGCDRIRRDWIDDDDLESLLISRPLTYLRDWIDADNGHISRLCDVCLSELRRKFKDESERVWNNIPRAMGLPPWEKLREMKREDLEGAATMSVPFLIFRELWPPDLGTLRLVCKGWYPEADQEFWSHVVHIIPLLRLIPESAWAEDTIELPPGAYGRRRRNFRITRPLEPQDWESVSKRARFVKAQCFVDLTFMLCSPSLVAAIVAYPPPSVPLFPNLSTITWINSPTSDANFFDPDQLADKYRDLRMIHLGVGDERHPLRKHVVLSVADIAQRYEVRLARALAACRCLQDVTLYLGDAGQIAPEIILVLSTSMRIRKLRLEFQSLAADDVSITESWSFPRFPALRSVAIFGLPLQRAWRLLGSTGRDLVGDISIDQDPNCSNQPPFSVESRDMLLSILRSIHDQYAPYRSLRALSLEGTHPPSLTFDFSDIEMFAVFPHMTDFALNFEYAQVIITDRDCEAIASWWPCLRSFHIGGSASPAVRGSRPTLTLRALLAFVERCPEFACLTLPMDATAVPILQSDASGRAQRYWALKELAVQDSPIGSGEELGAWMATTFPGLRQVTFRSPEEDHDDVDRRRDEWNRVKKLSTGKSAHEW
ncbi:uncharacterized protein SCHCODRAFT_01189408 [Schizophyllum commune H4-8]|nr:uncharacterized protein SCHCODRAFT_01189408 [Schizophyllum commune H4-8]KAI5891935.1 hypothetical protein SCHCODRAFT_01189408 [Schizophyllum commune H4-8]